jgi:HNH endonuclease
MDEALPVAPKAARIAITEQQALLTWSRDRWTCRYCSELVFFTPAFRALATRFGNHGYWHRNWKADESPLLIKRGASVDHVVAVTRGAAHQADNFVTACWECNLRKSNDVGWTPVTARADGPWDGMLAVFVGITQGTTDGAERTWRRAIKALAL